MTAETEHRPDATADQVASDAGQETADVRNQAAGPDAPDADAVPTKELATAEPALTGTVVDSEPIQPRRMIAVDRLAPHPGWIRDNPNPDQTLVASIAEVGVTDPVLIVPHPGQPGQFWVVDGVLRLLGARTAGVTHIPYDFDPDLVADTAAQHLSAYLANDRSMVKPKTVFDQLAVLSLAEQAGMGRSKLRKATGKTAAQLKAELAAGEKLAERPEALAGVLAEIAAAPQDKDEGEDGTTVVDWTLEEAVLIAPYADDPEALRVIARYKLDDSSVAYAVELVEREKARKAARDKVITELTAANVPVIDEVPETALALDELLTSTGKDAQPMTVQAHAECPGRCARTRQHYNGEVQVIHYCDDPQTHGHGFVRQSVAKRMAQRAELIAAGRTVTDRVPCTAARLSQLRQDGKPITADQHRDCPGAAVSVDGYEDPVEYCTDAAAYGHTLVQLRRIEPKKDDGPPMKVRIAGRKAWGAAAKVRQEWLASYLQGRKTAPKPILSFLTGMFVDLPHGVHDAITYDSNSLFACFTGRDTAKARAEWDKLTDARRTVLAFARLAAAFEHQLSGDTFRDYTWRVDRSNPHCGRAHAGAYLQVLITLGYKASPIERAVAAGAPYLGDGVPLPGDHANEVDDDEAQEPAGELEPARENVTALQPEDAVAVDAGNGNDEAADGPDHEETPADEMAA